LRAKILFTFLFTFQGIEINAELLTKLYTNWTMRVYHDISDASAFKVLENLENHFGNVLDLCFVGNLPHYGNLLRKLMYFN
jgi:hypothetical protein